MNTNIIYHSEQANIPSFARLNFNLGDVAIQNEPKDPRRIKTVTINDQEFVPTSRFMNSVFSRYGFGANFFSYFTPAEVIERIQKTRTDIDLEVTMEINEGTDLAPKLLAINAPDEHEVNLIRLFQLGKRLGAEIEYNEGKAWFRLVPNSGARTVQIGGDDFRNRFVMECPVDGYGKIRNYLELLRLVCTNGAIGYCSAFASAVNPGKDITASIERAMTGFDNPDGFVRMQRRFEIAQTTPPSLFEYNKFVTLLTNNVSDEDQLSSITKALTVFASAPVKKYGIVNPEALPEKKQRVLTMDGTVYDLINLGSELSTHVFTGTSATAIQGWIGETIANEYDMEGVPAKSNPGREFKKFHYLDVSAETVSAN